MKALYIKMMGVFVLISLLWLQAESNLFSYTNFFEYRSALIQFSGIIAITLMTMVMLLALRLSFIERLTQGLDKSYHLHKWMGIGALVTAVIHWMIAIVPKYLVRWDMLEKPVRTQNVLNPDSLYSIIRPLRSGAEGLGEWAFYVMLVLGGISLLGAIGYKTFKLSHKLMSACFLVIAYHSAILIKHSYWPYIITYLILAIIACGMFAAVWSLCGKIGKKRAFKAHVSGFSHDNDNQVTDLRLSVKDWPGHRRGQFAYVNIGNHEPHPFTIASVDRSDGQLRFLVKELGDFTAKLKTQLVLGQSATIEGPYGQFNFDDTHPQIWIGGGIGIATFKAALQQRQNSSAIKPVTLYYCTSNPSSRFISELEREAIKAHVTLKIIDGRSQPYLTVDQLLSRHPDIQCNSIWFCGPIAFSNQLTQDLTAIGYDLDLFHREYFSMR
ncbi:ferric reductase-like transmembrane domain-containing protein [Photobacterium profundum]|uniref:Hypothetical oxidoreductase n=1 Tax=Photobacterium profundum (strain SS9) TaxID=298386 RepID=Q6LKN5_PHOPR|nr:ferric reductase-like transmembrane domain-containing protein [Photobacterium profundum]CAG22073.1 hypothetical oxidoreductase [Photobacterium profundum SS9]